MKKRFEKYFLILVTVASLTVFFILYNNLSNTVNQVARTVLDEKIKKTKNELDNFFLPVQEGLLLDKRRGAFHLYEDSSNSRFNQYFIPFLNNSQIVSSLMLADDLGNELMLLKKDSGFINRETHVVNDSVFSEQYLLHYEKNRIKRSDKSNENANYDPRSRPWYQMADTAKVSWTKPYTFFTTKDPGITASIAWDNKKGGKNVLAYDVMLTDLSSFTSQHEVTKNGKIFILTEGNRVLGLPKDEKYENRKSLKSDVLKNIDSLGLDELVVTHKTWDEMDDKEDYFNFEYEGEDWWGILSPYQLGNQTFYIGVIAPEKDFLAEVKRTKWMIIIGMIVVLLFILGLSQAYRNKNKVNQLLNEKNVEINAKNDEIMDSINYAQRIQSAILPSDKYIKSCLPESFVLFKPKDVVSGDFYWLEQHKDQIFVAAADCTGHGVPGAMVSVVCSNALTKSLMEENITEPDKLLNRTRELVIQRFEKSGEDVKDGMDISLVSLAHRVENENESNPHSHFVSHSVLHWSGANNPLWIISKDATEVEEIKADKQPVGKFIHGKSFTKHELTLNKGDIFYMFSDGFADQFGGEKGKKYKSRKLKHLLLSIQNEPMEKQKQILDDTFESWRGEYEQIDDVCIIGVRI